MKKIIFILALFVSFVANSQYTPPTGYTNINSRYDWLAGVFRALGLPAGGSAAFTTGQAMRAGSVYYDSTGVDSGLHVWTGAYWRNYATETYTDADARAAISLAITETPGVLTYNSSTGAFNYGGPTTGGISEVVAGYGLLNVNDSTLDVDSLVIANRDWVMDRIDDIQPNLLFDSLGAAGISPITTWNNTLYGRRISIAGGSIDTTASGGLLITVPVQGWSLTGNAGTSAGTNFIGTTDAQNFQIKTNGTARQFIQSDGRFGFGAAAHATTEFTFTATRVTGANPLFSFVGSKNGGSGPTLQFSRSATTAQNLLGFGVSGAGTTSGFIGNLENDTEGLYLFSGGGSNAKLAVKNAGVYIGTALTIPTPTARLHIQAGTATAGTAPQKFTSGALLTTAEAGAVEFLTDKYYGTITTGAARKEFTLNDIGLTSGRFPFTTTNGRLTDVSTVLWDGTTATFPLLKITGGTPGAGKVLTSDADGDATWTNAVTRPTLTKNMTLESPTSSENFELLETPVAITITEVKVVLVGSGSPSVTYNLAFDADRSVAGTNVFTAGQTVTSTTTGTAASSGFNDATVPAGSYIRLTTSALTDATRLQIRITYTED